MRWNPSVSEGCAGMQAGNSYCVEAFGEPDPGEITSTTTTVPVTTTTTKTSTSTTTTTGGAPGATQSGQITTCNRWDLVQPGDTCSVYLDKYPGLTLAKLVEWNPAIGSQCQSLWVDTYLCTGVEGYTAPTTTTTAAPTTTAPSNGVTTPSPIQPGMTTSCASFHEVQSGDTCASIAQSNGISLSQFNAWNTGVGSGCSSLWLGYYVCVSEIGATTTTKAPSTTTNPGNGIATPTPTLPGMVSTCDAFYLVSEGDTCAGITKKKGLSLSQLYKWNTALDSTCSGLWTGYYVCVSVQGVNPTTTTKATTTTTKPGNEIATPTPIQPGMTASCKKFHKVVSGDQCGTIAKKAGISLANFNKWNPGVGSSCASLWLGYYVCIGV
ncbi:LysM peptidoglycan-binding domain-containing protein [Aspergillus mulundensis]|uniref:LysM domain-containing protein n=1 Tax=Aspergillus mulundensis TaxID=1810919 RepID=A0A3D8RQS9_9EURO|nr:hypothetical protein DSM5745_06300 [Aspergillus mulundensis]RDW76308.1 hypothetical protein DSM5745_06300 [Aspergillus mulundensis]